MDKKDLLILEMIRLLGGVEGNLEGLKYYMADDSSRKRISECKRTLSNGIDKAMDKFRLIKSQELEEQRMQEAAEELAGKYYKGTE